MAALLDKNMEVATEGGGDCQENEERLCEIPLQMMTDFNQQVSDVYAFIYSVQHVKGK